MMRKGALTVEASIVIPIVTILIFSMIMTSKVYTTYSEIDMALCKVSNDVSNFGFILRDLGIIDTINDIEDAAAASTIDNKITELSQSTSNILSEFSTEGEVYSDLLEGIQQLSEAKGVSSFIDAIIALKSALDGVYVLIEEVINVANEIFTLITDPDTYYQLIASNSTDLLKEAINYIGRLYVSYTMSQYYSENYYANGLFIVGDISYEESLFLVDAEDLYESEILDEYKEINNISKITATYEIDLPISFDYKLKNITLTNTVVMRGYIGEQ